MSKLLRLAELDQSNTMWNKKYSSIGESAFHQKVDSELADINALEIGYCARPGELDLRLIGSKAAVKAGRQIALKYFSDHCFTEEGETLAEVLVRKLGASNLRITTAESCTGGRISSMITDVSGASQVFTDGYVTYGNDAKIQQLGVSSLSLQEYGAVSKEVACEMALGALAASSADIAISVTGVAGPTGGSEEKPVGTVWIAVATKNGVTAHHKIYPQGREMFKQFVSQTALNLARLSIATLGSQ